VNVLQEKIMISRFPLALVATLALVSTAFQLSTAQTVQAQSAVPLAASASTAVPELIPFSGTLADAGKPISGETAITFLIFRDQTGGEPLYAETQDVAPGANGHYKVQLGATLTNGLPADLFATGEARWLEIQAAGQLPQPRVLMSSVPYALKAADSATLGGLPASAFVLAGSKEAAVIASAAVTNASTNGTTVTTTGGTAGYVPEFTGASTIADSPLFISGANVGINTTTPTTALDVNGAALISGALSANGGATVGGALLLPATGTATATAGFNSQFTKIYTSAYNSSSKAPVQPRFEWQGEVAGNNTASPSATLNLLSSTTSAGATETGFHFNANGTINFAPGQAFPGTGNGTITGVTAGTGLTGGGTTGNVTLKVDTTKVVTTVAAGTGLKGGGTGGSLTLSVDPSQVPLLNSSNTFSQNLTVGGLLIAGIGNPSGGILIPPGQNGVGTFNSSQGYSISPLGDTSYPLDMRFTTRNPVGEVVSQDFQWQAEPVMSPSNQPIGSMNLLYANGGTPAETGFLVNSNGQINAPGSLISQPAGLGITTPIMTIQADDTGVSRATGQQLSIQGATNPSQQLLIGYVSDGETSSSGGFGTIQATWDGYYNTPLLLNPNGGGVGIQTTNVTNSLTIGQGQGPAVADGWNTYSSRRFKTDIQTLPDALDKVEKLRGVSYTLKATGKREIGVIAEEVGKVVPELVTYEANGVDARSVDYTRLTALLIEAIKQQQAEINAQQTKTVHEEAELAKALRQINSAQTQIHQQAASISSLKAQIHSGEKALKRVRRELANRQSPGIQPRLVAAR
jgi:Chaperone of endosialidase